VRGAQPELPLAIRRIARDELPRDSNGFLERSDGTFELSLLDAHVADLAERLRAAEQLLVAQLLKETERRGGALDLHCFLLIMNTDDPGPGVSFTDLARRRQLSAKCINWRPTDGPGALEERLRTTILTVCARAETQASSGS